MSYRNKSKNFKPTQRGDRTDRTDRPQSSNSTGSTSSTNFTRSTVPATESVSSGHKSTKTRVFPGGAKNDEDDEDNLESIQPIVTNSGASAGTSGGASNVTEDEPSSSVPQQSHYRPRFKERRLPETTEAIENNVRQLDAASAVASVNKKLIFNEDSMISPEAKEDEMDDFGDEDVNIPEDLVQGIVSAGLKDPSRIQSLVIPQMVKGRNILGQAKSGMGKTIGFTIGALSVINPTMYSPQVVIVVPSGNLSEQIKETGEKLARHMNDGNGINFCLTTPRGLNDVSYSASQDRIRNIKELGGVVEYTKGTRVIREQVPTEDIAQIVVATPGRLRDIIENYPELFENVKMLIIDECDQILESNKKDKERRESSNGKRETRSFEDDIKVILTKLPACQRCFFSATLTEKVVKRATAILTNKIIRIDEEENEIIEKVPPVYILIRKEEMTLRGIVQRFVWIDDPQKKIGTVWELLKAIQVQRFIIYVNSKRRGEELDRFFKENKFSSLLIHGDMSKYDQKETIKQFKSGQIKCLISTDLLSRGIDIQQLSLVINFDLPNSENTATYIHRIGRTGRFGKTGLAISIVTTREKNQLGIIAREFECEINPLTEDDLKRF